MADDWVLKSNGYSLSRSLFEQTLQVRGFESGILSAEQQQALLRELFIRENLLLQQDKIPVAALAEFNEKLQEHRHNQLARLTLDALAEEGMPDFSRRARELYEVRKLEQYKLPLRLRVRMLRQLLPTVESANTLNKVADHNAAHFNAREAKTASLQSILNQVRAGKLDFKQAVIQHSDDPKRTLDYGDSFWFQRGQKADVLFDAAVSLSAEQPLSDVVVDENAAYLLQFIGRQDPVQQSFAEVEEQIIDELQTSYRKEQRTLLLTRLRERFQNDTEIHPDYQHGE